MIHLNIQQGSNVEIVSAQIIKKLYDTALTVSEPLEGETDTAYMSGNLQTNKASRKACTYLTTRFPNLHITVQDYYIDFEDPALEQLLITKGVSSDGVGVTESDAANTTLSGVFSSNYVGNTDITTFNEFIKFTLAKTNIPGTLFYGCNNLEEINLTQTISIGSQAFRLTGIKDINAPILESLSSQCFQQSKVETITNLGTITTIPSYAFQRCWKLTSATLPTTVTSIGEAAFNMYNVNEDKVFTTISGLENVTSFGQQCFRSNDNLVIQASDLSKAQTIGNYAFSGPKVTGELYMKNLTTLGESAFAYNNRITKAVCLGKITEVNYDAFRKSSADTTLTEVYLPKECTSLKNNCFINNTGLTILKKYEDSVDDWVDGVTPTSGNITGITRFANSCLYMCYNLAATIDLTGVTHLGGGCFYNAQNITFIGNTNSVIEWGERNFSCERGKNIDLSNVSIVLNYNATQGGKSQTFERCILPSTITLGEDVTEIPQKFCYLATGIQTVTQTVTDPNKTGVVTIKSGAFYSSTIQSIPYTNVQTIESEAFMECTNLTTINFPSLTSLSGNNTFWNCTNLTTVASLGSITSLPDGTFNHCTSLSSIPLDNITSIGVSVFNDCDSLTRIILPSIETVGRYTFNEYDGTQRVIDLGSSLTQIGQNQFKNNDSSIIIIRSNSVPTMTSTGNTTFYNAGWTDTTIYVPRDLINSYKADTDGWGRISGKNGREVFYALEDSIYANPNWYQQS